MRTKQAFRKVRIRSQDLSLILRVCNFIRGRAAVVRGGRNYGKRRGTFCGGVLNPEETGGDGAGKEEKEPGDEYGLHADLFEANGKQETGGNLARRSCKDAGGCRVSVAMHGDAVGVGYDRDVGKSDV